jgi:AcrR family transcriptional regulator
VVRSKPADRLDQLGRAALGVFKRKGYRQARMSDVARELGVSQGLLYTYVETKEALFQLVVERIVSGAPEEGLELPVRPRPAGETARLIEKTLRDGLAVPALHAALQRDAVLDPRSDLEAIIRQHYAGLARWRDLLALVERLALDFPEVRESFYARGRRPFVTRLGAYLERGITAGAFRPVPDPEVAARLVVETVAWFAYHRHDDLDSAMIDDAVAERTVVELLTTALVPDQEKGPTRSRPRR